MSFYFGEGKFGLASFPRKLPSSTERLFSCSPLYITSRSEGTSDSTFPPIAILFLWDVKKISLLFLGPPLFPMLLALQPYWGGIYFLEVLLVHYSHEGELLTSL